MLYSAVLIAHILIACVTVAVLAYAAFVFFRKKDTFAHKKLMFAIALLATLEVASGFLLAVISPTATVAYVATHLLWYLGLCLLAEAGLLYKMRKYGLAK